MAWHSLPEPIPMTAIPDRYSRYGAGGDLHESMVRAIYRGLVDHQETCALLHFKCATGNCTFGQRNGQRSDGAFFSSLALCHSCHDISHKITRNNSAWQLHPGHTAWNNTESTVSVARVTPDLDYYGRSFFSFDSLSLSNDTRSNSAFGGTLKAFTVRCSLETCVKTYHAEVLNSAYKEIEYKPPGERLKKCYSSYSLKQDSCEFALVTNSTIIDGLEHSCAGSLHKAPGTVRFDEKCGLLGSSYPGGKVRKEKYYPEECVWAVARTPWLGIGSVLHDVFIATLTKTSEGSDLGAVKGTIWQREMFAGGQGSLSTVEEVVRGVAQSVTAEMRNMPFGGNLARGQDVRELKPDVQVAVVFGVGVVRLPRMDQGFL